MPYEASFMSTSTLSQSLRKLAHNGKPEVDIKFDRHNVGDHTYTTSDSLSGTVSITSPATVRFDEVSITLEGVTQTFIELMSPVAHSTRQAASHRFLALIMPVPDSAYPIPRIAESGVTYTFPFNFVVPTHLLQSSCTHTVSGEDDFHVREAHTRLPPSMGANQAAKDDMTPEMAQVVYSIRVKVTRTREHDNKLISLVDKARRIRIIPSLSESPPLHIEENDGEYNLSASKTLKRGVFKGKLGTLRLQAAQSKALTTPRSTSDSAPTIIATMNLRFDPATSEDKPPRLGSLSSKIRASTFFSIRPTSDLPTRPTTLSPYEIHRRVWSETVTLASRCLEAVEWEYHRQEPLNSLPTYVQDQFIRRDSGYSTSSSTSSTIVPSIAESENHSPGFWTAKILVPLTLPTGKTWLPTFHSCIASRVYGLDISLVAHTPGAGVPATNLSVKLPLELISDDGSEDAMRRLSLEQGIDAQFVPRTLEPMPQELVGRSGSIVAAAGANSEPDLPPGYESFVASGRRVSVRT
jgi:hypothetical protein